MQGKKDNIYSDKIEEVKDFIFDAKVVEVFDDMVSRSVPLYEEVNQATRELALRFVQPHSAIYDLGCSTGKFFLETIPLIEDKSIRFVGIDNSADMLKKCEAKLAAVGLHERVTLLEQRLALSDYQNASVVVMNYTLQFLPIEERPQLLSRIYAGMNEGAVLIMSEKVCHRHPQLQETLSDLHHGFKKSHGYSDIEIAQKRDALEDVLIPVTTQGNVDWLESAGFSHIEIFFKWVNFASFIAVK